MGRKHIIKKKLSDNDSDSEKENSIKSKFNNHINKYMKNKIEYIKEQFKLNNIVSLIWLISAFYAVIYYIYHLAYQAHLFSY